MTAQQPSHSARTGRDTPVKQQEYCGFKIYTQRITQGVAPNQREWWIPLVFRAIGEALTDEDYYQTSEAAVKAARQWIERRFGSAEPSLSKGDQNHEHQSHSA